MGASPFYVGWWLYIKTKTFFHAYHIRSAISVSFLFCVKTKVGNYPSSYFIYGRRPNNIKQRIRKQWAQPHSVYCANLSSNCFLCHVDTSNTLASEDRYLGQSQVFNSFQCIFTFIFIIIATTQRHHHRDWHRHHPFLIGNEKTTRKATKSIHCAGGVWESQIVKCYWIAERLVKEKEKRDQSLYHHLLPNLQSQRRAVKGETKTRISFFVPATIVSIKGNVLFIVFCTGSFYALFCTVPFHSHLLSSFSRNIQLKQSFGFLPCLCTSQAKMTQSVNPIYLWNQK